MVDYELFILINSLAGKSIFLDRLFVFISYAGIIIIIMLLLLLRDKSIFVKGLIVMALVTVVDLILNFLFYRPRPFAEHEVTLLIPHSPDSSFPSGHAFRSFSLAQLLFFYNRKLGVTAFIIAFLVGLSRVFVGVHYPSDVIAGIVIGIAGAYAVNYGYDRLVKRHSQLKH